MPCPLCPAHFTTLQMLAKKIGQLEKKIAEHERAAGGSLPDLQVGQRLSQPGMFFPRLGCGGSSERWVQLPAQAGRQLVGLIRSICVGNSLSCLLLKPIYTAACHAPRPFQAQYEASRACMAKDGRRFRDAIALCQAEEHALKLRIKKLKEVGAGVRDAFACSLRLLAPARSWAVGLWRRRLRAVGRWCTWQRATPRRGSVAC